MSGERDSGCPACAVANGGRPEKRGAPEPGCLGSCCLTGRLSLVSAPSPASCNEAPLSLLPYSEDETVNRSPGAAALRYSAAFPAREPGQGRPGSPSGGRRGGRGGVPAAARGHLLAPPPPSRGAQLGARAAGPGSEPAGGVTGPGARAAPAVTCPRFGRGRGSQQRGTLSCLKSSAPGNVR